MGRARFILGRAATGKTRHIVEQIVALCRADPLGPPIYWLVPKQATFQAERTLTALLGGFARVRVVDFGRLGEAILESCGDVGVPDVTPAGRRMVIGHLLRANRSALRYYRDCAHRPGLAAELDATFGEFERAGVDQARLADVVRDIGSAADPATDGLRQKLEDVHLLLSAYVQYVKDKLDPQKRLAMVLDRVRQCPALRSAVLFVDDVYDLTAYERTLLAGVADVVDRTEIALLLDPHDPGVLGAGDLPELSVFHRTARTYRALRRAFEATPVEPPLVLRAVHGRAPQLAAVERELFTTSADRSDGAIPSSVEFLDAPDARAEVDAVARQVRAATTLGGLRYRDVAVLVRSLDDYREIVEASFREHGIPYFADHRRSAGHHPLLQMVRAALLVVRNDWPAEAVMTLAKCGLTGLSDDEADRLENYVLQHRLRGRAAWESDEPWAFDRELTRAEDAGELQAAPAATVDALRRRLAGPIAPLRAVARGATVREVAVALFAVLDGFGVRRTLSRWIADAAAAPEQAAEHEQVWSELTGLFDQMIAVIGDEQIKVADFLDVLDSGLEGFDLALAPATVDQVLLGQVDRTRPPDVRLAFVLGLAEGRFPVAHREALVLSDAERRSLRNRNVDLDEDTERQLLDERFLAYFAFTRPSERLVASRPLADDAGRALNPSLFWLELQRACPDVGVQHVPRASAADPQTIGTPRQLVDALMRWVRADQPDETGVLPALYQWLAESKPNGSAIDRMRFRAWRALSYRNEAALDPAHAAGLFTLPLRATVRQLEDAAACPFRHFARHGLLLTRRESADVTGLDLNNAYHAVVEALTRELLARGEDWTTLDPGEARERIATHAGEVGRQLRGELMLSTARNRFLLDHIERTLARTVASMAEFGRRGKYRPAYANLRFGGDGAALPAHEVTTPRGRLVQLHGRIDRVDVNQKGTAFTVADYRLAAASLPLDQAYYGLSLQLLAQLLVVRDGASTLVGKPLAPAAAFLLGLLRSPGLVLHPDDAPSPDDPDFHLRHKPRGIIDERAIDSFHNASFDGQSPVVAAYRKKDGTLGNRHVSDVAAADELAALLAWVDRRLGQAADRVVDGDVAVRPYMLGRQTPCARCDYRTVCRFEPGVNTYRVLQPMRREDVLLKVLEDAE
jgi:ATP-dependent helicase/nuclease subunit B